MTSDLKKRMFDFSLRVMRLAEALPDTRSGRTIANQIVRSGTSVGANYRAAKCVESKWVEDLLREANELLAITVSSIKTAKGRHS